ncbi:MAG: hydantoinase/oxoprolinase family protein, partial [Pseudomonadota bacterium]
TRALVPPGAGVGSAIGFLRAPFSFEATRSLYMKLTAFDPGRVTALLRELGEEATAFVRTCDATSPIQTEVKAYMRYTGQGWEIPISLDEAEAVDPTAATFLARFEEAYTKLFGRPVAGLDVEITVWSVNASTPPEEVTPIADTPSGGPVTPDGAREIFDPAAAQFQEAALVPRAEISPGQHTQGPAAITEAETTIIVPSESIATGLPDGCIDLHVKG